MIKRIKVKLCKWFGHKWVYSFNNSSAYTTKTEIRHCKRCNQTQQWYKLIALNKKGYKELWMNMITYTDKGAKNKLKHKYQK